MEEDMGKQSEWLKSFSRPQTKKHHERSLRYFLEFTGRTEDQILEDRKALGRRYGSRIVEFWQWLQKAKRCNESSSSSHVYDVASYFRFYELPLMLNKLIPDTKMKLEKYTPTLEDLQKLFRVNDIMTKTMLSLFRDVPARIGDILQRVVPELPRTEFMIESQKECIVGKVYVSDSTIELFNTMRKAGMSLPKTEGGVIKALQKACKIADVPFLNPHLFRKHFTSVAINLNINETIIKVLTFKSVPKDMLTYFLNRTELRETWQKVVLQTPLQKTNGNGRLNNVEEIVNLTLQAMAKLVLPEVKSKLALKQASSGGAMSLIEIPKLSAREILEEYLKT
jgi:integrase